jgi:hypothetical protein
VAKKPKLSEPKLSKEEKSAKKAADKEQKKGKKLWKIMGTGSAAVAGIATAKALDAVWKTATGRPSPDKPENPALGTREAIAWSALSGMAIAVAKTYATRRAASYWVRSTGRLPPGMPAETYHEIEKS